MAAEQILGDWGSTRLRLWRRGVDRSEPARTGPGILASRDECANVLADELSKLDVALGSEIWLCGMAGARDALIETPYLSLPANAEDWRSAFISLDAHGYRVKVAPGLRSAERSWPDVMRGEEAQIFGALSLVSGAGSGEAQFLCPGTHSKWARTKEGTIVDFTTIPTGELYARLLGSSLAAEGSDQDVGGFDYGLRRSEEGMAGLFETRAGQLLEGRDAVWARGYLSGLLIGMEFHSMRTSFGSMQSPIVIGEEGLAHLYLRALTHFGIEARSLPADSCTLAGLELAIDD